MNGHVREQLWDELEECVKKMGEELVQQCARYDDALKRINDLQAENEALRMELARRN